MLKDIDLILFDLDGTLVEFHYDYLFDQADLILSRLGEEPVLRDVLRRHFSEFDFFQFVPEEKREWFIGHFWSNFDWTNFPKPRILPGVDVLLEQIWGSNRSAGVVTSRAVAREQLHADFRETGILERMAFVRTRTADHLHWSDKRDSIGSIIAESKLPPERIAMIGDIPPDISSARAHGLGLTVAVLTGGLQRSVLEQARPDLILNSVADISTLFFSK